MNRRGVFAAGLAMAAATAARAQPASLIDRFAAALSAHDMVAFAALLSDDYVNHQTSAALPAPAPGKSDKQGTLEYFAARLASIPDLSVAVETSLITDAKVAGSFVYTGRQTGPMFGMAATGRPIRFTTCEIFAVRGGQLVEHWGMSDIAGIFAQIRA